MDKEFQKLHYLDAFIRLYKIQGLTDFKTEIMSKDIDFEKVQKEVPKLLKHYKKSEIGLRGEIKTKSQALGLLKSVLQATNIGYTVRKTNKHNFVRLNPPNTIYSSFIQKMEQKSNVPVENMYHHDSLNWTNLGFGNAMPMAVPAHMPMAAQMPIDQTPDSLDFDTYVKELQIAHLDGHHKTVDAIGELIQHPEIDGISYWESHEIRKQNSLEYKGQKYWYYVISKDSDYISTIQSDHEFILLECFVNQWQTVKESGSFLAPIYEGALSKRMLLFKDNDKLKLIGLYLERVVLDMRPRTYLVNIYRKGFEDFKQSIVDSNIREPFLEPNGELTYHITSTCERDNIRSKIVEEDGKLMIRYPKLSLIYLGDFLGDFLYDFEIDVKIEHTNMDNIPITDMSIFTEEEPYFLRKVSNATFSFDAEEKKIITLKYKYKLIDDKNSSKIRTFFIISNDFAFNSDGITFRVGSAQYLQAVNSMSQFYKNSPVIHVKELMV